MKEIIKLSETLAKEDSTEINHDNTFSCANFKSSLKVPWSYYYYEER